MTCYSTFFDKFAKSPADRKKFAGSFCEGDGENRLHTKGAPCLFLDALRLPSFLRCARNQASTKPIEDLLPLPAVCPFARTDAVRQEQ